MRDAVKEYPVRFRYFTNIGKREFGYASTVEQAIVKYRKLRSRNWGEYTIDNGQTWHRI